MNIETKKIDWGAVWDFASVRGPGVVTRALLSFGVVLALLALYYAFAPRTESYRTEVQITLESRGGVLVYPNGDKFGMRDLISAPVLNRIWKKYGFAAKGVEFEEFCSWFSVFSYDKERAKIDAEFQGKMSKRNITVTELSTLQKEYETKLASLSSSRFAMVVCPGDLLPRETAAQLLADVPECWFKEYATIKAPLIPAVVSTEAIAAYVERSKASGGRSLELVDAIRKYLAELKATCNFVRSGIMCGRNVVIEGADLGMYEAQLELLQAEILRLKNRLLVNGGVEDTGGYVAARLDDLACEQMELDERVKAVQQTLDVLGESKRTVGATSQKMLGTAEATPVTVQADAGFFADFAMMIRRDANQELVHKYAQELTSLRQQLAELAARKFYYDQIERYLKANTKASGAVKSQDDKTAQVISNFTEGLFAVGKKIVAFRDRCLEIYRTSDQFYVIASPAAYAKSFAFSTSRLALGLLALWFLYNLVYLVKAWNRQG